MSWPLRFRSDPEPWKDAQIGDWWYYPNWESEEHPQPAIRKMFMDHQASRQYAEHASASRPPIIVKLPIGPFCPDEMFRGGYWGDNPKREGWMVHVEPLLDPPEVVVMPSVNIIGMYHGWINDGHVSDDVEGRTFRAEMVSP